MLKLSEGFRKRKLSKGVAKSHKNPHATDYGDFFFYPGGMTTNIPSPFSPELIAKAQRIFKERCGIELDVGHAEIILDRLARLGLLMTQIDTHKNDKNNLYGNE